jgi:SAM-dependent methyltransferase
MNLFRIFSDFKRLRNPVQEAQATASVPCPICTADAPYLDTVDFNKACTELQGKFLPASGIPIKYHLCDQCGFCFAPEFRDWKFDDFEKFIYNADYEAVDPEYVSVRPTRDADILETTFGANKRRIRHLDYGGGSGLLSKLLKEKGWNSTTYDPFVDRDVNVDSLGKFDLITVFEVFEHVPDSIQLIQTLKKLCQPKGLIVYSTLMSDGNIDRTKKLQWWYAAPRNGHVSLFSQKSIAELMTRNGLDGVSFSNGNHAAFVEVPDWAGHLIRAV